MRISDVSVILHDRPSPFTDHRPSQPLAVVTIETDARYSGHAFLSGSGIPAAIGAQMILDIVRPMLIGQDALDIGRIWSKLSRQRTTLGLAVVGAVDVALWDLTGKTAGLPLHRLLGTSRDRVPAYLSSWIHTVPEDYVHEALHYQSKGFTAYKIHPPTQRRWFFGEDIGIDIDIKTARAVRNAVGPAMTLMWDSPRVYEYSEALRIGSELQDLDYLWFEDPLPPDDIYNYRKLKAQLRIPLMATEMTEGGFTALSQWVLQSATDYLRGDVALKGGVTALMKIAHLAEAFHLGFEVHDGFNSLNNIAGLHVALAVTNRSFFEIVTVQPTGEYGLHHFSYGLKDPIEVDATGYVTAPSGSGLGAEIDWDLISSRTLPLKSTR